jgi:hypothetical protein
VVFPAEEGFLEAGAFFRQVHQLPIHKLARRIETRSAPLGGIYPHALERPSNEGVKLRETLSPYLVSTNILRCLSVIALCRIMVLFVIP